MHSGLSSLLISLLFVLIALLSEDVVSAQNIPTAHPVAGERIDQLLKRNNIDVAYTQLFIALNWQRLSVNNGLLLGKSYILPTSADIQNAEAIIREAKEKREKSSSTKSVEVANAPKKTIIPIFGKAARVDYVDHKLKDATYFLCSGHGGPDPGALSECNGTIISEDEYAYDVTLRLAKFLISHHATVYVIIRDPDDGIRDDAILPMDDHETCMGDVIPLDQIERLRQRTDAINKLYKKEKHRFCRAVFLHVDSRSRDERIDIFFYHFLKSTKGQKLSRILQNKLAEKYHKHQPYRGFGGEVKARNLFVLREAHPISVFIELGNLQNPLDLVRFTKADNREAMASWLCEGLIEEYMETH